MKVLCCANSFKGSLSAEEACAAMAAGASRAGFETVTLPLSDGGEGFLKSMIAATGGELRSSMVSGPNLQPVKANWAVTQSGTAIIEMAECAGLHLASAYPLAPLTATTRGVGELILEAVKVGCKHIIVGLGGSATTDAGAGMLRALGIQFFNRKGKEIGEGGSALADVDKIDTSGWALASEIKIEAACDVDNPLLGPNGAASVYAPQKGASHDDVAVLENGLSTFARLMPLVNDLPAELVPGGGAAGGLGAALASFCSATLLPGSELMLNVLHFDQYCSECDVVLTGEGSIDGQTIRGKIVAAVARRGAKLGLPIIALGGKVDRDAEDALRDIGLTSCISITDRPMSLDYATQNAYRLTETASNRILCVVRAASRRG